MLQQNYLLKINRVILNRDKHTRDVLNFVTQSPGMVMVRGRSGCFEALR
jgi:hypothetical protein